MRVPLGRRVLDKLVYLFPPHDVSLRIGAFLLFAIVVLALFAPVIAPYGPDVIHSNAPLLGPSSRYLLGTDELGRDVLSRVIYGTQSSLEIGFAAATVSAVVGVPLGLLSGYREGAVSTMVMRVTDVLLGFPGLVIVMVVSLVFHEDLVGVVVAIGLLLSPSFVRVARSLMIAERGKLYVDAARALGANTRYLLFRVVFPNAVGPLLVQYTLAVTNSILLIAGLSFLGLGVQPPTPSWGLMIQEGSEYLVQNYMISVAPGIALVILVFALNSVADGISRRQVVGGQSARLATSGLELWAPDTSGVPHAAVRAGSPLE